jgi:hypothetical protein
MRKRSADRASPWPRSQSDAVDDRRQPTATQRASKTAAAYEGTPLAAPTAMTQDPNQTDPPAAPAAHEPASEEAVGHGHATHDRSEEAVGHGRATHDRSGSEEEEQVRDVDPHPDTPDDFDDDATVGRESVEAVPGD